MPHIAIFKAEHNSKGEKKILPPESTLANKGKQDFPKWGIWLLDVLIYKALDTRFVFFSPLMFYYPVSTLETTYSFPAK